MNTKAIAVLVVGIIVVASVAVIVFGTNVFTDPWWETKTTFGEWQDELVIEYADGTTDTLKLIQGKIEKLLEYYDPFGKEIISCYIILKAKVTGTDYDGADLKCDKFGYQRTAWNNDAEKIYTGPDVYTYKEYHVPIGDTQTIMSKSDTGCSFATMLENQPDGGYRINWEVKGSVDYKGYPNGGEWETAVSPPDRSLAVVKTTKPTGQIVVTLTSEQGAE